MLAGITIVVCVADYVLAEMGGEKASGTEGFCKTYKGGFSVYFFRIWGSYW